MISNYKFKVLFCSLLLIFLNSAIFAQESTWSEAKKKNGVSVFLKEYPGSSVDEFLGKTDIEASLSQVITLLTELDSCKSLYFNCKELLLLSGNDKRGVVYVRNGAPWPVADRDVVMDRSLDQNPKTKVTIMKLKKTDAVSKASPSGVTRMDSFEATWRITPVGKGKVHIEYQAHFEPGGSIPQSVINLAITDTPYHTLLNLRKSVEAGNRKDAVIDWIKEFE